MSRTDRDSSYEGREQTLVKHVVLEKYLERFAIIVGSWNDTINYVDGFSGPWNIRSDEFADSSFAIALRVLRRAREALRARGRTLRLRCFFIEANPKPFERLAKFAQDTRDAEVVTKNSEYVLKIVKGREADLSCAQPGRPNGRVRIMGCTFGRSSSIKPDHLFCGGNLELTYRRNDAAMTHRTTAIKEIHLRHRKER